MKIAIDASSAARPDGTGIARYISSLVENLEKIDDVNTYYICYRLSRLRKRRYFYKPLRATTRTKIIQEPFNVFFPGKIDLCHGPDARLPRYDDVKLVATIHDLFSLVSEDFARREFREMKIRRYHDLVRRSARLISDSENTKREIIEYLGVQPSKVKVVYPGVGEEFSPRTEPEQQAIKEKLGIEGDYIFFVGDLSVRKNVSRMVRAFSKAMRTIKGKVCLVLAGKPTYGGEAILKDIRDAGLGDKVRLLGHVPDDELAQIYGAAKLFLFTTLYEGFGLPVLESMASGVPVLTSNVSSLPEVAGNAAKLVDPLSVEEIADGICELWEDDTLRTRLIGLGLERARLFNWERTARETLRVYRDVLGQE